MTPLVVFLALLDFTPRATLPGIMQAYARCANQTFDELLAEHIRRFWLGGTYRA